tara:strand:- start:1057 stop:2298 length:1242 start_codon:yes stop_codon:yes gene_type:complete
MALTKVQSAVTNSGVVNVLDFGATGDGVTDDLAAFQATINSTTDGKLAVIHIPQGSYKGALSSLTLGTRVVNWICESESTFVDSIPPGTVSRVDYRGDNTRPWTVNGYGFGKNITTGLNTDSPALRVDRYANHSGGTVGGGAEPAGFAVVHNVFNTALNYETGAQVTTTHQGGNSNQNIVALHTETRKAGNGAAGTFGLNIVVHDQTNNASSVSLGSLIGAEFTGSVGGADDAATRHMIDVVMKKNSSAGSGGYTSGLRVRTSDSATRAASVTNGVMVQQGAGGGTMTTGVRVDSNGTHGMYDEGSKVVGINLQGTYSSNAIRVKGGDKYGFETTGSVTMAYNSPVVGFAISGAEKVGLSLSGTSTLRGLRVDTTRVVGPQGAAVADATDVSTAISGLNSLLSRLRVHGLIAT